MIEKLDEINLISEAVALICQEATNIQLLPAHIPARGSQIFFHGGTDEQQHIILIRQDPKHNAQELVLMPFVAICLPEVSQGQSRH